MNYAVGAGFNLDDIFYNFDESKLKGNIRKMKNDANNRHKNVIEKRVFREMLKTILNDIIDNNVTFELPTNGRKSSIYVKRIQGKEFINARKNGKWTDIDFLESNFSGNQLTFSMQTANTIIEKPIYVNKELRDKLVKYTNEGKQYC